LSREQSPFKKLGPSLEKREAPESFLFKESGGSLFYQGLALDRLAFQQPEIPLYPKRFPVDSLPFSFIF
jgi:hypothetical protein